MKPSKEFFERLQTDEEFAKEIAEKIHTRFNEGETDVKALWIPVAAEYGYELTGEELDEMHACATEEISDEELGKLSGGVTPLLAVTSVIISEGIISVSVTVSIGKTISYF